MRPPTMPTIYADGRHRLRQNWLTRALCHVLCLSVALAVILAAACLVGVIQP